MHTHGNRSVEAVGARDISILFSLSPQQHEPTLAQLLNIYIYTYIYAHMGDLSKDDKELYKDIMLNPGKYFRTVLAREGMEIILEEAHADQNLMSRRLKLRKGRDTLLRVFGEECFKVWRNLGPSALWPHEQEDVARKLESLYVHTISTSQIKHTSR